MLLAATLGLAASCAGSSSVRFGDRVDVSSYPPEIQAAYRVFAVRCSRCHTLARPLNARIRDEDHWVRYVTRMRRNPSSGINRKDAEIILRFLLYYTQQVVNEEKGESFEPGAPQASTVISDPVPMSEPAASDDETPAAPGSAMTDPATTSDGGVP